MTVHAAILRELIIAGYEGAPLLAAFDRLCAALAVHGVVADSSLLASPAARPVGSTRAKSKGRAQRVDPDQLGMLLVSDFAAARATRTQNAPAADAGVSPGALRMRKSRARQRAASQLVTGDTAQAVDFVEETVSVALPVTAERHGAAQVVEIIGNSAVAGRHRASRRNKKEVPPHPLKKKLNPLNPQADPVVTVGFDDPLMAMLEEMAGHAFPRFGKGRSVRRAVFDAAMARMAERSTAPPGLKATG